MSYFASSASPELAHWHESVPAHLIEEVKQDITTGAGEFIQEVREIYVQTEHSLAALADELGIHPFHHQISCNLTGCRLILQPHGQLEIHRSGSKHPTSFPVQFRDREIVEV